MKLCLLQLWLLLVHYSSGGGAEQNVPLGPSEVLGAIQDLLFHSKTNPIQGERYRRDANGLYDMEFSLPIGLKMGVKFTNPSDVKAGGVASLNIDNSRKFMPFRNLKNLNIKVQFSGFELSKFDIKALISMTYFSGRENLEATAEINQKCKNLQCETRIKISNAAELNIITGFHTQYLEYYGIWYTQLRTQLEVKLGNRIMKMGNGDGEIYFVEDDKPETRIRFLNNRFEGVLQGKTISGHITKNVEKGKNYIELKYKGRKELQIEFKANSTIGYAKYSFSGGKGAKGKLRYKIDSEDLLMIKFKEHKSPSKQSKREMRIEKKTGGYSIEFSKDGLLMWKDTIEYNVTRGGIDIQTHLEISPDSQLYKAKNDSIGRMNNWGKYLFDKKRTNRVSFWSEKYDAQNLIPKIKSSFKFENDVGGLFNIELDSISKIFSLGVDLVDHSLQVLCDQTANGKHGQTFKNEINLDGEEYLKLNINTLKEMNGHFFSFFSRFDYMPKKEGTGIDFKLVSQSENQTRVEVKAEKMQQELCNYVLDTKLLNTQTDSEIALNDTLYFRESNFLEKYLPSNALNPSIKDFSRLNQQKSVLNVKINKEQKHVRAKGSIKQDGQKSLDFLLNTEKEPSVFRIKTPRRKGSLDIMGITVNHKQGQYIELKSDYPYFKEFRINRIGRNKQEILWNGENMGIMEMKGTIGNEVKSTLSTIKHAMAHIFENLSKMEDTPRILKDGMMIFLVWIDLTWEPYASLILEDMKRTRPIEAFDLLQPLMPVLLMIN